jgi:hypothetical protein
MTLFATLPVIPWQPIDTAPEGIDVLVFGPDGTEPRVFCAWRDQDGDWWDSHRHSGIAVDIELTHWMPLPLPPEAA